MQARAFVRLRSLLKVRRALTDVGVPRDRRRLGRGSLATQSQVSVGDRGKLSFQSGRECGVFLPARSLFGPFGTRTRLGAQVSGENTRRTRRTVRAFQDAGILGARRKKWKKSWAAAVKTQAWSSNSTVYCHARGSGV